MRVLAADDEEAILRVLDRLLRSWGYEPAVAADGVEAWRLLKRADAPPIAILDWDMPGISGLEVCRLLRATPHGADAYVLVLTARQHKADLIEALEAGADDFLSKPFEPRELQLRLAKGVTLREARARFRGPRGAPPSGTALDGKYRLEKKIGEGGMASVWLAVHLSLGINVAVKFMKPDVADMGDYASFEREARAAAQLRNEHIVRVYDHGVTGDGLPYLVMEYIGGESLRERVERAGPLTLAQASVIVDQVGRALTEAHARGIIHRDVKPDNILLVEDPDKPQSLCAKLVDFGLAKPDWSVHSSTALSAGTPAYMSPEHLRAAAPANPALDLWGLAATTFVAVTGVVPFDGSAFSEIVARVCEGPPPVPSRTCPRLPPGFDAWFARACARDPRDRFATAQEMAAALREAAASSPAASGRPNVVRASYAPTEPDSATLGLKR